MSFVRTLALLGAGFAAAKGYDKYKKMGGMAGVQEAMRDNPQVANVQAQVGEMLDKMGVPGGSEGLKRMMEQWTGAAQNVTDQAAAGMGGLIAATNAAMAGGAEQAGKMMDAMTGTTRTSDAMEDNAKLMIRAMIQAAKADGEIDAEERTRILDYLNEMDVDELAFVEAELDREVDFHALAAETGEQMKAQVYAMSLMAVQVDSDAERKYLDGLAQALGLSDETRAAVRKSMGLS